MLTFFNNFWKNDVVYYLFDFDYSFGFNFYIGKLYLISLVLLIFEFALPNLCGRDAFAQCPEI